MRTWYRMCFNNVNNHMCMHIAYSTWLSRATAIASMRIKVPVALAESSVYSNRWWLKIEHKQKFHSFVSARTRSLFFFFFIFAVWLLTVRHNNYSNDWMENFQVVENKQQNPIETHAMRTNIELKTLSFNFMHNWHRTSAWA